MTEPEPMRETVAVRETCRECHSHGILIIGLTRICAANPRDNLPGVLVFGFMLTACMLYLGGSSLAAGLYIPPYLRVLALVGMICGLRLVMWWLPLRIIMCAGCRKITRRGWGRAVPLEWLEEIEPHLACSRCGYSLVGARDTAECSECGHPFPSQWLNVTTFGRPDIECGFQVVDYLEFWIRKHGREANANRKEDLTTSR